MAIDPPYRLDPFQNIVNVNWGATTAESSLQQIFIWRRWVGPPFNNGWNGDWYPVTDDFWAAAVTAGEAMLPKHMLYVSAFRSNLSDLIDAAATLDPVYAPGFPFNGSNFNVDWAAANYVKSAWAVEQPTVNPAGTQTPIYSGTLGAYNNDDMGTASGHFWPPPFELPPLP